jgi:tetratricopeptide (TPR) repeat protein
MRKLIFATSILMLTASAFAQSLTLPPPGDNQKSTVIQNIGPVSVRIDYNSPDVHAPNGDDRRGKIWGELVPYGLTNLGFGTCTQCPWRVGSNENTVLTVSHDVTVNGQKLPAGAYGLHMIADPNEWTVIFSKNSTSWGSYFYDAAEDALRVKVKPEKAEYNEWLTFEFTDRRADKTTVAMKWEELSVPFTIAVPDISEVYMTGLRNQLRSSPGFDPDNVAAAARYALTNKRLDDAMTWAERASNPRSGRESFDTLSLLADVQQARGMTAEAKATRERAFQHATATPAALHQYARQQLQAGNKDEAVRVWKLNAQRFKSEWPVNVGLARAYSASGDYKQAVKYAKLALAQAPDDLNKTNLERMIKDL